MDIDRLTLTVSTGLALLMLLPLLDQYIKLFPALIGKFQSIRNCGVGERER